MATLNKHIDELLAKKSAEMTLDGLDDFWSIDDFSDVVPMQTGCDDRDDLDSLVETSRIKARRWGLS